MSVDYSAKMAAGIIVDPDTFFFNEKIVFTEVCGHKEAAGNKFCPVCGRKEKDRIKQKKSKVPKPGFEVIEDYADEFPSDCPYPIGHGLQLICLKYDPYAQSTYVLGTEIGYVSTYSHRPDVVHEALESTESTLKAVREGLEAFGIKDTPRVFLAMSVS